jgi:deoxyribodipyrimidine photo-lyase
MSVLTYQELLDKIDRIDPVDYARTRNHLNGSVTRLSPYISRGVIHTRTVFERIISRGWTLDSAEKLIQELAWRDYWQQIWELHGFGIESDLRKIQPDVQRFDVLPAAVLEGGTGIHGIDSGIHDLHETGYVHNHQRMYIASLVCNIARCHWFTSARWMYYHLLDGDWASNCLSWQWVAGTFSDKKYFCNQENIDKYCGTSQPGSFLDVPYEDLPSIRMPEELSRTAVFSPSCSLPDFQEIRLDSRLPLLIHTSYNLDPLWHKGNGCNRVLLLEPSHFKRYPVSEKVISFVLDLAAAVPGLQCFRGEFEELERLYAGNEIRFRSHPFNSHFRGTGESRPSLTKVHGVDGSFFKFWKSVKKELRHNY